MERIICLLIGYAFGLFQTAYIYGRLHGIDIRNYGSGNAGTTNTLRVFGTKAGLLVLVGDIMKCILAVVLVSCLFGSSHPEMVYLLKLYAAMGAIVGHNFPFYLKFKGGKGIAATAGLILYSPIPDSCGRNLVLRRIFYDPLCVSWLSFGVHRFYGGADNPWTKRRFPYDTAFIK